MAFQVVSQVLTQYRADVSDHTRALEKLKGAERERAQASIDANKQVEGGLQSHLKMLTELGIATGAVIGAAAVAWDAFKASMERSRLEATAGSVSLDRLKTATLGLRRETDLLRDAAALQSGAFKLNEQQMATVERAMLSLSRQGKDAEQVHDKLLQAVTALKTDGLQDLGIFIDKAGLSMDKATDRAKLFERIMAELAKTSAGVKDGQRTASESVEATAVSIQDSIDRMKVALGKLVEAMAPLLESLAGAVGLIGKIVENIPKIPGLPSALKYAGKAGMYIAAPVTQVADAASFIANTFGPAFDTGPSAQYQQYQAGMDARAAALAGQWGAQANTMSRYQPTDAWDQQIATGSLNYTAVAQLLKQYGPGLGRALGPRVPGQGGGGGIEYGGLDYGGGYRETPIAQRLGGINLGEQSDQLTDFQSRIAQMANVQTGAQRYGAFQGARQQTLLEQMFGPVEQFNVYRKAFDMLSGAVGASITAWIQGSMSVGQAFKKFIGEALTSLASQMAIEALKHGAYALGSLAFLDFRGASQHGAAAAAFGAGSIAAAVAARQLGAGGTQYGKGAGAAAGSGSGGGGARAGGRNESGGGGSGGRDVIIAYADPYADDSPRARLLQANRIVSRALGSHGVRYQ